MKITQKKLELEDQEKENLE